MLTARMSSKVVSWGSIISVGHIYAMRHRRRFSNGSSFDICAGLFNRSDPLPTGGQLEQADSTGWMAFYSLSMLNISLELSKHRRIYEDSGSCCIAICSKGRLSARSRLKVLRTFHYDQRGYDLSGGWEGGFVVERKRWVCVVALSIIIPFVTGSLTFIEAFTTTLSAGVGLGQCSYRSARWWA